MWAYRITRRLGVTLRVLVLGGLVVGLAVSIPSPRAAKARDARSDFAGGSGTEDDPYQVATAEQLHSVRDHLDAHFVQTEDIDLGIAPYNEGGGWEPIGSFGAGLNFTGSFDGGGHTIRDLTINRPATKQQGLFGYIRYASLSNIHLEDVHVQAASDSGSLVGYMEASRVEGVTVTGAILGPVADAYVAIGGLAGSTHTSTLHHIAVTATVQGGRLTGGLVGRILRGGAIRHAYTRGSVEGTDSVGGLVGYVGEGVPIISDTYSRASVSGTDSVGGLIGDNYTGAIYRSYSTGSVAGTGADVGGLMGSGADKTFTCYWNTETSGQAGSAGGEGVSGRTTAQMQQQATYKHYNFITLWTIDEGNDYPVFRDLSAYDPPQPVDVTDLEGTGTDEDPYIITTIHELNGMRQDLTASYRLMNDLDLADSVVWNGGLGWEPVGPSGWFTGSFDGGGYAIRNLTINRPHLSYQGLFRRVDEASLSDFRLQNVHLLVGGAGGGLAGEVRSSSVEQVAVTGTVIGSIAAGNISQTGGLAGSVSLSVLDGVSFAGTVQGGAQAGGLVGRTWTGGEIRRAYTTGTVKGGDQVGGLVGYLHEGVANISDTYSQASVTGTNSVGGLIGQIYTGAVDRSYSTGVVSGAGQYVGGLVGVSSGTAAASFWDVDTSGQPASAEGTGKTTAQMQQRATFEDAGWDFASVWGIQEGASYPYLLALLPLETTELIPLGGGSLFSIIDQTAYEFAAGTFTDTVRFTHTYQPNPPPSAPEGRADIGYTFIATAVYSSTGQPAQPTRPVTITIHYGDAGYGGAALSPLSLWRLGSTGWVELEGADDPVQQTLTALIDHLSQFAVFGEAGHRVFLPLVVRQ